MFYEELRDFADTWGLIALMAFFIGAVLYTFRPGSKEVHDDISRIPFRNDGPRDDASED